MAQLRQDYQEIVQQATEVLVVGPEDADQFQDYWKEHNLPFVGLPDPRHQVLRLYGQEVNLFKFGRMPAQVLIDRNGTVRFVHYGKSMADIPDNRDLLDILENLNREMEISRSQEQ